MITHDLHKASPIGLLLRNPLDAKLLRHFLASMGHGITVLDGDAQSLQAIEGSGLILADEASASRHAERLLEMKREADPFLLPVLVMAGGKSDSAKWIRRGFDDVLRMPLVKGELMVRLETFLRLRAASQRAHKESEERFRVTFDEAPSGIAHTALDGRVLMVNRRLCEMLGYGQAELLRLRSADITFAEDIEATQQLRRRVIVGRSAPPAVAKRYVRKDGTVFWGELSISSVRDDQGEPKYFINIISDISARKALESRLERLARARHFMAECNRILVHATAETQLLEDMCREAVTSGGYRIAWVGMAQQDARKTVLPVVSAGPVTDYLKSEFISWSADHPSGQGAIGRAIRSGELTEIADIAAEASLGHWHALAEQRALRSVVVLPLKVAGSVIGGMAIVSGSAGALSGDERELLGELAADISYGIETLRTRQAHAAAEKALCESERFARSTIDALVEHICVLDESGTIIAINRSWRAFAAANGNVDRDCIAEGCNYLEVWDRAAEAGSDEAARVAAAIRAAIAGNDQGFSLEYACHAPDEQRWFLMRVSRFAGEGSTRVVVSHEAVTERRLMEDALRASEERFRSLTNLSSDWYWEQDEKFRFTAMSGSTLDMVWPHQNASIGKTRREMHESEPSMHYVGMTDADWVAHQAMLDTHRAFRDQVYRHRRADGQTAYVSVSGEPVFNEHGVFKGYRGTGKDITAQKAVEQALRDSEERFRSLTNLSSDWYWEQDKDFRFTSISGDAAARSIPRDNFSIGRTRQEMHALRPSDYYIDMNEADWLMHQALLDA
ncbi:MAG TPA: PAS domain S-box protein, partial [Burkholderiales bacterium]